MYTCLNCKKEVEFDELKDKIICSGCGFRIFLKKESKIVRKVSAR